MLLQRKKAYIIIITVETLYNYNDVRHHLVLRADVALKNYIVSLL